MTDTSVYNWFCLLFDCLKLLLDGCGEGGERVTARVLGFCMRNIDVGWGGWITSTDAFTVKFVILGLEIRLLPSEIGNRDGWRVKFDNLKPPLCEIREFCIWTSSWLQRCKVSMINLRKREIVKARVDLGMERRWGGKVFDSKSLTWTQNTAEYNSLLRLSWKYTILCSLQICRSPRGNSPAQRMQTW